MKKPDIKKLKYPLWFNIIFYLLTVMAPLVLTVIQGFRSTSQTFRITFGLITGAVIAWSFIRKFVLINKEKNLLEEKVKLEHEYKTGIGDGSKIRYLWYTNETWLALINAGEVVLKGLLVFLLAEGIAKGLMKIEGLMMFIMLCYLLAFIIKFSYVTISKNKNYKSEEELENGEQTK